MNCLYPLKTITLKDFDRICRTCLRDENIIGPIVNTSIGDLDVIDLLKYSIMIEVTKDDCLPQNICETCLNQLYAMYEFKKKCQENEAAMKKFAEDVYVKDKNDKIEDKSDNITLSEDDVEVKYESNNCDEDPDTNRAKENDTAPKHKCFACDYTTSIRIKLREHQRKHRKRICEICKKICNASHYYQHLRTHTQEKPYQCEICFRNFSLAGNLRRHKMTHTGERPYVCSVCGKGFIQAVTLHVHEKIHQTIKKSASNRTEFPCDICGRVFRRFNAFNVHIKKHTSDTVVEELEEPEKINGSHTICSICGRAIKTKQLKAHMVTHGEKSFLCKDCGKGFVTKTALHSHAKVHTGEKPYSCEFCKKSFAHFSSKASHMLIHSGCRPYSCSRCTMSFKQSSQLMYHMRTHSGERPYTCSYCNKSFALNGNLTVHMRQHTGETPFICPVCGKRFYDSSSMKKHKRNHEEA